MASVLNNGHHLYIPAQRGKMTCLGELSIGVFRLPTDPLFYGTLVLSGIVSGSRYRVTMQNTPYTEIATGTASSTTETLTGKPVYENPMLVDVVVRNASGATPYKEFQTSASMILGTATAYILQVEDD